MAKASWAVVNPSQGSGNKTVNVSSDGSHTGREVRSTTLTITAANVTPVNVTVNQAGKPAYVQNNSDTASAAKGVRMLLLVELLTQRNLPLLWVLVT